MDIIVQERHGFKKGDKVRIMTNTGVIKRYDNYIGETATIDKIYGNDGVDFCFMLRLDKYDKFKTSKRRYPKFGFSKDEIEKI